LDFRSYGQGRKQFDRFFQNFVKYYTTKGRSSVVYYGAGCANARGKGERGGSPVNAQTRACMRVMTTND
jgi:hypothetical protein